MHRETGDQAVFFYVCVYH